MSYCELGEARILKRTPASLFEGMAKQNRKACETLNRTRGTEALLKNKKPPLTGVGMRKISLT